MLAEVLTKKIKRSLSTLLYLYMYTYLLVTWYLKAHYMAMLLYSNKYYITILVQIKKSLTIFLLISIFYFISI